MSKGTYKVYFTMRSYYEIEADSEEDAQHMVDLVDDEEVVEQQLESASIEYDRVELQ